MKINNTLLLVFFFLIQIIFGQNSNEKEILGKITADSVAVEGINILNSTNQRGTVSDRDGFFSLLAKEGDILVFSAVNLTTLYRRINKQDLVFDKIKIQMTPKSIMLEEVIINENSKITAENLGIIPYGQKKYTAAERRLETAGDFKPIMLLSLLGGSMPFDPLINKINGRTKRLKKLVVLEKKEECVKLISELYNQEYLTGKLGIPADYVNGFKYFAVENEKFTIILKSNNKTMTSFLIGELAAKYNEIIASENK
ncbi:carboxypeptidase-like regulatory domain-containing protein [Flavobacterium urumqiense]|uniref:CarboxypepD_reg-like domain-containing protein n=1 Tax=Flavobacterium urumqiense TaxID=935224 RepID=A0A1H5U4R2_9FLAO|nr:carboxypeptidase-like regulatory domain-containing protein [Flavobacterium urumqiense]SEF69267.1 CarboxypepD_reg-like domain-containing protein [Flavobacterium urumqiense]